MRKQGPLFAILALCISAALSLGSCTTTQQLPAPFPGGPIPVETSKDVPDEAIAAGAVAAGVGLYALMKGKKKLTMRDALEQEYQPGSLIIVMQAGQGEPETIAAASGLANPQIDQLDAVGLVMIAGELPQGADMDSEMARIEQLEHVQWVQREGIYELKGEFAPGPALPRASPSSSSSPSLSAHAAAWDDRASAVTATVAAPSAQAAGSGGVSIAMIDAVVDLQHEALKDSWLRQQSFVGANAASSVHGTAIASVIAGRGDVKGAAPAQRLTSYAAFIQGDDKRPGNSSTRILARALNAAAKAGPDILNMSFGGPDDRLLKVLVGEIYRKGTCIFAATGNGGKKARPPFPANLAIVNGITALDRKMRAYKYATPGRHVAAAAYGVKRLTAVPGGYRIASGTSFASAYVAGQAASLPVCSRSHDPAALYKHIVGQSRDLGTPGRDDIYGYGQFRP